MHFVLKPLPYERNALAPIMSEETLEYHHGKHHLAYITKLNELQVWTPFESQNLEDIIRSASGPIFNNAAQIWNHDTFWESMIDPTTSQKMSDIHLQSGTQLFQMIETSFWSFQALKDAFKKEALWRFGSGWTWLVQDGETLKIYSSPNAENPLTLWGNMLLGLDVWEHSYYIDYRNDRAKFVDNFWSLVNWEKVVSRLK